MTFTTLAFALLLGPAAETTGKPGPYDWPQWRGPNRDAVSKETGLMAKWPSEGPPKVWNQTGLGGGFGSPCVAAGKVFGAGTINGKESAWCLKETDGSQLWSQAFATAVKVGHGEGPRCTPTYYVDPKIGPVIYVVGMGGDLVCLKAENGALVWRKNYVSDFGGEVQKWGFSESVLIDDGKLICAPGSEKAALAALNPATGATTWTSQIPKKPGDAGGYCSPIRTDVNGVPMYVTLLGKNAGAVGVNAKTGKLLWQYAKIANHTANIPTVIARDDLVWCSTGYGDGGAALLKLVPKGDGFEVKELAYYKSKELQNHHGGMVLVGDYLYFGHAHGQGYPACVEFKTGKIAWKEEKPTSGGSGSAAVAAADGMVYFRYQNAQMVLMKANPKELEVVSSFRLPDASKQPSWPHPVIANGRLYVRDQEKLHCFNVKATTN